LMGEARGEAPKGQEGSALGRQGHWKAVVMMRIMNAVSRSGGAV
jgi:hypothetical protein